MAFKRINLLSYDARTVTGEGSPTSTVQHEHYDSDARFFLKAPIVSGTSPTLDVNIVATVEGVDHVLASFTQLTAAGQESLVVSQCPETVKIEYTIGGTTPSFTFAVEVERNHRKPV